MAFDRETYLQPSKLCDFDRYPQIRQKAASLVRHAKTRDEKFRLIASYVKELPYRLDDWDVKASEVIKKGWGMCSGKTNLLVAMLRSKGIPARYRIYQIKEDTLLWEKTGRNIGKVERLKELGQLRDHVDCEVWLGRWVAFDPARDTAMEQGILKLGGSLERQKVTGADGRVHYLKLAALDHWAKERQARRTFRSDRKDVFAVLNRNFEMLREFARS